MLNKKILPLLLILAATVTLSACQWRLGFECTIGPGGVCKTNGSIGSEQQAKLMKGLKPITEMLAQSYGYTYEEWFALDPSDFSMAIQGSYATADTARVTVISNGNSVGSSDFAITNTSGEYRFSNPGTVKDWAEQYIDAVDSIEIELEIANTGNITSSIKERGTTRASASYQHTPPDRPGDDMEK